MALLDLWDYLRASGDRRLREQGFASAGMGLLERYRRVPGFWAPHLENNRGALLNVCERLGPDRGGTALILGAGRLLDVPWEQIFPRFDRVVLADADFAVVPYVERVFAHSKVPGLPKPIFEIGDATASVVDTAAWAAATIQSATSPAAAGAALARGFADAGTPEPPWARAYTDVRLAVSTNLLSQLGHFPRLHIQERFRAKFRQGFSAQAEAARALESYFDRVRARHVLALSSLKGAHVYLSGDVRAVTYQLKDAPPKNWLSSAPADGGVTLDERGALRFAWPVNVIEESDPLNGQDVGALWPDRSRMDPPRRWAWHIVPQGCEKRYAEKGRVHIVEAWTQRG